MASKIMMFVPAVLVAVLVSGCVQYGSHASGMNIKSFTTDRETYGSTEDIEITVVVYSDAEIKDATVKVSGIKPYQYSYIDNSRTVDISPGDNEIIFREKTPYCTAGCGGVYPGPYKLNAEIFVNNEMTANSTTTINLVSD